MKSIRHSLPIHQRLDRIEILLQDLLSAQTAPMLKGQKEIAAFCRVSLRTVARWTRWHGFPAPHIGKRIRSHPSLILHWLLQQGKPTKGGGERVGIGEEDNTCF